MRKRTTDRQSEREEEKKEKEQLLGKARAKTDDRC